MTDICCIISLHGFILGRKFLGRELAWIDTDSGKTGTVRFNLNPHQAGLTDKERQTIRFTTNKLHGLSFVPSGREETENLENLGPKLLEIYEECKAEGRDKVAYKGSPSVKKVLDELNIPNVNLEQYGCPKFANIEGYPSVRGCGFHNNSLPCAVMEVAAYNFWLSKHKHEFTLKNNSSDESGDDDDYL